MRTDLLRRDFSGALGDEGGAGSGQGVEAGHVRKLVRILSVLDVAHSPEDPAIPSFRTTR